MRAEEETWFFCFLPGGFFFSLCLLCFFVEAVLQAGGGSFGFKHQGCGECQFLTVSEFLGDLTSISYAAYLCPYIRTIPRPALPIIQAIILLSLALRFP